MFMLKFNRKPRKGFFTMSAYKVCIVKSLNVRLHDERRNISAPSKRLHRFGGNGNVKPRMTRPWKPCVVEAPYMEVSIHMQDRIPLVLRVLCLVYRIIFW